MPEEKDYVTSWVGVDLDNTLAEFDVFRGWGHIGEPIKETVDLVKSLISKGVVVKIFTARAAPTLSGDSHIPEVRAAVREWTLKVFGVALEATCQKDAYCVKIIDDISVHPGLAWLDGELMRLCNIQENACSASQSKNNVLHGKAQEGGLCPPADALVEALVEYNAKKIINLGSNSVFDLDIKADK